MTVGAIITAGGAGRRFSSRNGVPKQFRPFHGIPLYAYSLTIFASDPLIKEIVLIIPRSFLSKVKKQISKMAFTKEIHIIAGGNRRQESVMNGFQVIGGRCDIVVIHDAVRPFIKRRWIKESVTHCRKFDGAIVAVPATDTLKDVQDGMITKTINREHIFLAQTPQTFRTASLRKAYRAASRRKSHFTDEAMMVEAWGGQVAIVYGETTNIKITTKDDWNMANLIREREMRRS